MNCSNRAALHARDRDPRWNHISLGTLAWALKLRERSALSTTIRNMILNDEPIKSCGTARERPRPQDESHPPRDSSVGTQVHREKCSVFNLKKYDFEQLLEITNWSNSVALHARDRHLRWNHTPLGTSSVGTPIQKYDFE